MKLWDIQIDKKKKIWFTYEIEKWRYQMAHDAHANNVRRRVGNDYMQNWNRVIESFPVIFDGIGKNIWEMHTIYSESI